MKNILLAHRAAFLAAAMAAVSVTATFADTTTTTSSTTTPAPACTGGHHHGARLTDAEKAQLKTARDEAFAADPTLKTQHDTLKQQFEAMKSATTPATADQKKALFQQAFAYHKQLEAAELKINPALAPVIAKADAGKHHWHHRDQTST